MDDNRKLWSAEENRWGEMTGDCQPVSVNHDLAVYCHCTYTVLLVSGVILHGAAKPGAYCRET
jgi:hypothetical protein